jgi:RNA polymerase sigma-70 factor (ECF subfamily)
MLETELRQYIDKALDKLPPVCREVFVMNRFEGLRPAEIAEKKGISVRTVEGHIGKALKIMKTELEQFLPATLVMLILKTIA